MEVYVINNPLKYTDPTGHMHEMGGKSGPSGCGGAYTVPDILLKGNNKVEAQSTTVKPKTVKAWMDISNSSNKLRAEVNSQRNSTKSTGEIDLTIKPSAENERLQNAIDQLYRPNA